MSIESEENDKIVNIHPFLEYIESIISTIPSFYTHDTLSLITYRLLPEMAQCIVNQLLLFNGPIPFHEIRSWFRPEFKSTQNKVLWRLKQLQILQGRGQEVWINTQFQSSLIKFFSTGRSSPSSSASSTEDLDYSASDSFARSKWEMVLYELVKGNSSENSTQASTSTQKRSKKDSSSLESLLVLAGLLNPSGRVTTDGFQFLLKDISTQIWSLLIHFFKSLNQSNGENCLYVIKFVSNEILFGRPGRTCDAATSQNLPVNVLSQLEMFGLLMKQQQQSQSALASLYRPTRLLTSLSARKNVLDFTLLSSSEASRGFLVIETNFRVYAYTSSALQIATLALFLNLHDRFPNLAYGQLTMESVQTAMAHGITADQIIHFLQINAHPCMIGPVSTAIAPPFNGIPFTVIDQIRLWELDRKRLANRKDGYLYQQFLSEQDYLSTLEEAKTAGSLLYAKPANRILVISEEGHEHMRQFIKQLQK